MILKFHWFLTLINLKKFLGIKYIYFKIINISNLCRLLKSVSNYSMVCKYITLPDLKSIFLERKRALKSFLILFFVNIRKVVCCYIRVCKGHLVNFAVKNSANKERLFKKRNHL